MCAQCFQQFPEGLFYEVMHTDIQVLLTDHTDKQYDDSHLCMCGNFYFSLIFYLQFEGRKYCEHDFQMLFAPCCHQCGVYCSITHSYLLGGFCKSKSK